MVKPRGPGRLRFRGCGNLREKNDSGVRQISDDELFEILVTARAFIADVLQRDFKSGGMVFLRPGPQRPKFARAEPCAERLRILCFCEERVMARQSAGWAKPCSGAPRESSSSC